MVTCTLKVPTGSGPSAGNGEARFQQTFDSGEGGRWEIYNDYVRFYLTFSDLHANKTIPFHVLLHETMAELDAVMSNPSLWQPELQVTLVATPDLRPLLGWGKTKLMTALTWTDAGLFLNGSSDSGSYSYLETFAKLGFNTVPGHCHACPGCGWRTMNSWDVAPPTWAHPPGALADEYAYPGNRTAKGWDGLQYGPELSGFGRLYGMVHKQLNASLLPSEFVVDEAEEMLKWQRAQNFTLTSHGGQNMVDMAYNGAWVRADIADFCSAVNASRPEWIFVDDEGFPGSWAWSQYGHLSANAEARRLPSETDFDLSYRMITEFLSMWSGCLKDNMLSTAGRPTMIGYYDTTFDSAQFQAAGIVGMPSEYGSMKDLGHFARGIQEYRSSMVAVKADGLGPAGQLTARRQLLPVLTACTYGQMTASDVFAGTLQTFGAGASGFSFFAGNCFDDPGKILALSTAAGLAAPFEDHFFTGSPIKHPDQLRYERASSNVLSATGMCIGFDCFLVVTPTLTAAEEATHDQAGARGDGRVAISLTLVMLFSPATTQIYGCELISGQSFVFGVDQQAATLKMRVAGTAVLHLTLAPAPACEATPLWLPPGQAVAMKATTAHQTPRAVAVQQ